MIRDKLSLVKSILTCLLISQISYYSNLAYTEQYLESLTETFREDSELTEQDQKVIENLWQKYSGGSRLTTLEDITVFEYENWINKRAKKIKSIVDANWVAYRRIQKSGWKLVAHNLSKDGMIYEVLDLKPNQTSPHFNWSPNEIELVLEIGFKPKRRIVTYNLNTAKVQKIAQSEYDDSAPFYDPEEPYILFFSNRDRESINDHKLSLYAAHLENPEEVLRLTQQEDFLISTDDSDRPKFTSKTNLILKLRNSSSRSYDLRSLLMAARQAKEQLRKKQVTQANQTSKTEHQESDVDLELTAVKLDEFEFKDSAIRIEKENQQINLREVYKNKYVSEAFMSMPYADYQKFPGPIVVTDQNLMFFIKPKEKFTEIWSYSGFNRQSLRVSPAQENCFGMQFANQILTYLTKRNNVYIVTVMDYKKKVIISRTRITEPLLEPGRSMLKLVSPEQVYFLSKKGEWQPVIPLPEQTASNNLDEINPVLVFQAPHLPKLSDYVVSRQSPKKRKNEPEYWSLSQIKTEIDAMRDSIQWVSTSEEHQNLMARYNQLHGVVSNKINAMQETESESQFRLKARWIESLNGLKELLENSKLLLEVE